jgi:hypothetical protein
MKANLNSSAPHFHPVAEWQQSAAVSLVLCKRSDGAVEAGIQRWQHGTTDVSFDQDCLCYFFRGKGVAINDAGERIEIAPDTAVHFKQSWRGTIGVSDPLEASYMTCGGGPAARTPVLREVLTAAPLKDWGAIPTMTEGTSLTAGILLSRQPNGRAESGIWTCTPGEWKCEVTADEFCHFLEGSCTYTHEGGETIEIEPDTLAFFPQGWRGACKVRHTIRKVYMIR